MTLLHNGTSWLNMYQATVKACDELSASRGREELAAAAHLSYQLQAFLKGSVETDGVDTRPADGIKTCEALVNLSLIHI